MASGGRTPAMCKSSKSARFLKGVVTEKPKGAEGEESNSLLSPAGSRSGKGAAGGGATLKKQKSSRRNVKWKDHSGNRLVEVLEFQPSDSSDSDDEDQLDSCICSVM